MAYELVEHIEVGAGGAASIEFTGIPQDGVDLVLVYSGRRSPAVTTTSLVINVNGASTNLSSRLLQGDGSSATSSTSSSSIFISHGNTGSSATADTFSNVSVYISNYASSSPKSISADSVTETNATNAGQSISAHLYNSSTAITSLSIINDPQAGTSASLYKIY